MTLTGSMFAPLVQVGTPWRSIRQVVLPGRSADWAPTLDHTRLAAYDEMTALIENRPWDVLNRLKLSVQDEERIVMALAMPELLCTIWADAVYGDNEPPEVTLANDAANARWQAIAGANDLDQLLWEATFGTAALGTSVLKLRRDEDAPNGEEVVIEEIHPSIYFPILKPGSARIVEAVVLAWEETRGEGEQAQVWQVEQVYEVDAGQLLITYRERRAGKMEWTRTREERPEGIGFLPFVDTHAKRWAGRFWGMSELTRNWTQFAAIDEELSGISEVLDYHGDPVLQVPASALTQGTLYKNARRTLAIRNEADADIARYITWEGMVTERLGVLKTYVELAMLTAEVPPAYWGMVEGGEWSGTALRLRLQAYLKKAARYQANETRRIQALVRMALTMDPANYTPEDLRTQVAHGSPLPADEAQDAQTESTLVGAGLSSRETSVRRLRRVPSDKVDEELAAIEGEQAATVSSGPALPPPPPPLGG